MMDDEPVVPQGWHGYAPAHFWERSWRAADWTPGKLPATVTSIRFMPDYGAVLPLWNVDWARPPFDASLLDALADLQDAFDEEFDAFDGWESDDARDRWAATATSLITRVRDALPRGVELTVDLWPLGREPVE